MNITSFNKIVSYTNPNIQFNKYTNKELKKTVQSQSYEQSLKLNKLKPNKIIDDTSQFSNIKSCLSEIESLVNRTKDLVEFSTKETLAYDDRVYISEEISNLSNEIDRNYNNNAKEFEDISSQAKSLLGDAGSLNITLNAETLNLNKIDVSTSEKASKSLDICNKAKYTISNYITSLNKFENILNHKDKLSILSDNSKADEISTKLKESNVNIDILNKSNLDSLQIISLLN